MKNELLKDYRPVAIFDNTDFKLDMIVMLEVNEDFYAFERAISNAQQRLFEENYDYDGAYWDALCEYLKDFDFITYTHPEITYY